MYFWTHEDQYSAFLYIIHVGFFVVVMDLKETLFLCRDTLH